MHNIELLKRNSPKVLPRQLLKLQAIQIMLVVTRKFTTMSNFVIRLCRVIGRLCTSNIFGIGYPSNCLSMHIAFIYRYIYNIYIT